MFFILRTLVYKSVQPCAEQGPDATQVTLKGNYLLTILGTLTL